MPRPDPMPESPQVPVRPVLTSLGVGAVLIGISMAGLMGYYAWKASALTAAIPRSFPAPQLETALQRIPQKEPPAIRPPSAGAGPALPIDQAMARVVERGPAAYDSPEAQP